MRRATVVACAVAVLTLLSCKQPDPNLHPSRVVNSITVGGWIQAMVIPPDGGRLYVASQVPGEGGSVAVVRPGYDVVIATVRVGSRPTDLAVMPDGEHVYVGDDPWLDDLSCSIWVMRTEDYGVAKSIPVPFIPSALAVTPDGRSVYVGNWYPNPMVVVRTADNTVVDTIVLGSRSTVLAVSPDGACVYAGGDNLYVIWTSGNTVADSVTLGSYVTDLAVLPDGSRLYAAAGAVYALRLPDNTVEDSVVAGRSFSRLVALPSSRFVYASCPGDSSVYVIRTSDDSLVERIPLGCVPASMVVHPDGSRVYVADQDSGRVVVIGY